MFQGSRLPPWQTWSRLRRTHPESRYYYEVAGSNSGLSDRHGVQNLPGPGGYVPRCEGWLWASERTMISGTRAGTRCLKERGSLLREKMMCTECVRRIPANQCLSKVYGNVHKYVEDLSNETEVLRVRYVSRPRNGYLVRAERILLTLVEG